MSVGSVIAGPLVVGPSVELLCCSTSGSWDSNRTIPLSLDRINRAACSFSAHNLRGFLPLQPYSTCRPRHRGLQYCKNTAKMTDGSPPGLSLSPSVRCRELIIPTANPAKEGEDVFISLSETVAKLKEVIAQATAEKDRIVFIRAPVAAGKTTLANYLTTKHSDEFLKVASATSEDMWYEHVIDASGEDLQLHQVRKALMAIARQGKTIVIDEAHLMFPHPNVVFNFFKNMEDTNLAPRFLLFPLPAPPGTAKVEKLERPTKSNESTSGTLLIQMPIN
jgi:hypothetical protein